MRQKLVTLQEDNLTPAKHENKCSRCRIDRSGLPVLVVQPANHGFSRSRKDGIFIRFRKNGFSAKGSPPFRRHGASDGKRTGLGRVRRSHRNRLPQGNHRPGLFAGRLSFRHRILQPENRLLQGLSPGFRRCGGTTAPGADAGLGLPVADAAPSGKGRETGLRTPEGRAGTDIHPPVAHLQRIPLEAGDPRTQAARIEHGRFRRFRFLTYRTKYRKTRKPSDRISPHTCLPTKRWK